MPALPRRLNPCCPQGGVAKAPGGRRVPAFPQSSAPCVRGCPGGWSGWATLGGSLRGLPWVFNLEGAPGAVPAGAVGREPQGRSLLP